MRTRITTLISRTASFHARIHFNSITFISNWGLSSMRFIYCQKMSTFGSNCEYTCERNCHIGKGTYGTVYKATVQVRGDFVGPDIVAVKEILLDDNRDGKDEDSDEIYQISTEQDAVGKRLDEERDQASSSKWKSLLRLNHKNIVRYHKITLTDAPNGRKVELMMDYFPAGDLASLISKRGLAISIGQLVNFAQQMAEGVAYLHSAEVRVIHGDLKPANVMLRRTGDGQFALQIGDLDDRIVMIHNQTCTKDVKHTHGTARYMSPEMVKQSVGKSGVIPGRKTDVWSLGCTILDVADFHVGIQSKWLYHKRTGDTIRIDGKSDSVIFVKIADGYVPLINELAPRRIARIIDKCLHEDVHERISAEQLVEKLKQAHDELVTEDDSECGMSEIQLEFIKLLDKDSSGTVYEARRLDTTAIVAVRSVTLHENPTVCASQLNVLRSRFAVVTELDHPSVVRYFHSQVEFPDRDRFASPTRYNIIMERCAGRNVSALGKEPITALHVQKWTRQLLNGIAYIHDRGVVHRNITGNNILMTSMDLDTCHVKIGGLCDVMRLLSTSPVVREVSHEKGTWNYMAPELIAGDSEMTPFHERIDIWSLGCVMVQLATGKPPEFYKKRPNGKFVKVLGDMAVMYFVATGGTPRVPAELPPKMRSFAEVCFIRDPSGRPSAADLKGHEFLTDEVAQWVLPRSEAHNNNLLSCLYFSTNS